MRKYSLQYVIYLTINKSLKYFATAVHITKVTIRGLFRTQISNMISFFVFFFWKDLLDFSKKPHRRCLKGSEYASDTEA